jgi:hypothetical protein
MNSSTQIIIYYVKSVKPIGEPGAPYQGLVTQVVAVEPGYMPTEQEIYEFIPYGEEVNTILAVSLCLN